MEWKRSSRCKTDTPLCVEVAVTGPEVAVRDSKRGEHSPVLTVGAGAWQVFGFWVHWATLAHRVLQLKKTGRLGYPLITDLGPSLMLYHPVHERFAYELRQSA